VLAAVGLNAHRASADDAEAPPPDAPPSTTTTSTTAAPERDLFSEQQRAQLARAQQAADATPAEGPVHTNPPAAPAPEVTADVAAPPAEHVDLPALDVALPTFSDELVSLAAPFRGRGETSWRRLTPAAAAATPPPAPLEPAPVDDPAGKRPTPTPSSSTNATVTATPVTPKATPPPAIEPASSDDAWYPAWVADEADQRIAEKWRLSPVRGPPPSTATALGNDARNTTTQVAVVRDRSGHTTVAVSSQTATVHNVGLATADGHGGGDANATGNRSDTSIVQVSVIEVRGSGSATVQQSASVDNLGTASATTAGAADATAIGNDSQTSVTQIAVVFIEGSGDAHLTQSADVDNVGVASADASDRDATAVGNTSSTNVTQIAVVHVSDDDANVSQTSTTSNIGVATATGGTASGNTATNTTTQVVKVSR
jgi:hypothetical protein